MIQLYYADHPPPHFHVSYAGQVAKIDIDTLALIDGSLPARARGLVTEWATLRQDELREAFRKASDWMRGLPSRKKTKANVRWTLAFSRCHLCGNAISALA